MVDSKNVLPVVSFQVEKLNLMVKAQNVLFKKIVSFEFSVSHEKFDRKIMISVQINQIKR